MGDGGEATDNRRYSRRIVAGCIFLLLALAFYLFVFPSRTAMIYVALLGAAALVVILYVSGNRGRHTMEALAALLTCLALMAAGYWYFVERRGLPKLNATPSIQTWAVEDGMVFVRVELLMENVGSTDIVMLPDDPFRMEIGQVLPLAGQQARDLVAAYHPVDSDSGPLEILQTDKYPSRAIIKGGLDLRIEPGETEKRYFKAVVPCVDGLVSSVRVDIPKKVDWFQGVLEQDRRQLFWRGQAISDPITTCNGEDE